MIKNLSEFNKTLGTYDAKGWTNKADLSNSINLEKGFGNIEGPTGPSKTFGDFLQESVSKVNSLQEEANTAMQKLASGESKNLHETLLTVEQAEISFKAMNQIRTKVIEAYKEIMRMQI